MENFIKGMAIGVLAGTIAGAMIVAKNKKLSKKINEGSKYVEDKFNEIKDDITEKMQEQSCSSMDCKPNKEDCYCGEINCDCNDQTQNNKKSKNR